MRDNGPVTKTEYELPDHQYLVSRTDARGVIEMANDGFVAASGFTRQELLGQSHNIVRHPDMPAAAFADLWSNLKEGRSWVGFVKNRRKNGDFYWVRAAVSPVTVNGKLLGYISVRTKPSRSEVAAADVAYARIRAGDRSIEVVRGQVARAGIAGLVARSTASLRMRLGLAFALVLALVMAADLSGNANIAWTLTGTAVLVAIIATITITNRLGRAVAELSQGMDRVAGGRFDDSINLGRQDEFAPLMLALATLQTKLGYISIAEREARTELMREFDASVGKVLGTLAGSIESLRGTAQSQSGVSAQVASNAQTVASSSSELNASIKEIANQATQVSELARSTAEQAKSSREIMARLAKAGQEITAVAKLIAEIAEQTNLLALNATIEAARAGDVGRGFAVVAGEVKSLANQTQSATGDINRKIQTVQSDTQSAVQALEQMAAAIDKLNDSAHTIAAAVEEQSAVVDEVAKNAEQTAAAAGETGTAAKSVADSSESLAQGNVALSQAVERFKAGNG